MTATGGRPGRRRLEAGQAGDARTAGARRIATSVGLLLGGRVATIAVGLITLPLLARALGAGGYGTWSAALAYVGIFSLLTEFGLSAAATMRMAAEPEKEAEWLAALASLRTVFSVGLTVVCLLGIPLALPADDHVRTVAAILSITILAGGAQALMAVFQTRLRNEIPLAVTLLQCAVWATVVAVLAVVGTSPTGVAVGFAGVAVLIASVQVSLVRRIAKADWRGARERWGALLSVAVPLGLATLFTTIYYRADLVLLYNLADAHEAGIYGGAYRFLDPLVNLPAVVVAGFFPVLSATFVSDPDRARRLVRTCAALMAVLSFPAFVATFILAEPLVAALLGPEFERSAGLLPILMGAFVSICFGNLAGILAPIIGLQWRITLYAAIGAAANVALNLVLIPRHGAYGSAWATIVTEFLSMGLLLITCLRAAGITLPALRMVRVAAASGVMGLAMIPAASVGLLPALLVMLVVYPVALVGLKGLDLAELREIRSNGGDTVAA